MTVSRACGVITIGGGVVVMAGWLFGIRAIVQIHPTFAPIQFNTALCLALCGVSMVALPNGRRWRVAGVVAALLAAAVTSVSALQYLTGHDFGLDQAFVDASFATARTLVPGRMAPQTAGALLTAALVMLGARLGKGRLAATVAGSGGTLLAAIALTAFTGYATTINDTAGWLGFTRISPQAAAGILVLATGLIAFSLSAYGDQDHWMPAGFPVSIAVGVWMVGALLVTGIHDAERRAAVESARAELDALGLALTAQLTADGGAIRRMALRWVADPPAQLEWEADAGHHVAELASLERLEWRGPGSTRWVSSATSSDATGDAAMLDWLAPKPSAVPRSLTFGRGRDARVVTTWPLGTHDAGALVSIVRPARLLERGTTPTLRLLHPEVGPAAQSRVDGLDHIQLRPTGLPLDVEWHLAATSGIRPSSWLPLLVLASFAILGGALGVASSQYRRAAVAERTAIDRRTRIESLLHKVVETELLSKLVLENTRVGTWDLDVATGAVQVDDTFRAILGRVAVINPIRDASWHPSIHPDDETRVRESLHACLRNRDEFYESEYRARRGTGEWIWVNSRGRVVARDADGAAVRMVGTIQDVSERKRGEAALRDALDDRSALLRELHHRVKNNLAAVSSLLYLQASGTASVEVSTQLHDSRRRVQAIALVHDMLHQTGTAEAVDLFEYLARLLQHAKDGIPAAADVTVAVRGGAVVVAIDQAVPCGLIVNELATNAMKHAFNGIASPQLDLSCGVEGDRCTVVVRDNGRGMRLDADCDTGIGLGLVKALARQLEAGLAVSEARPGVEARIDFTIRSVRST